MKRPSIRHQTYEQPLRQDSKEEKRIPVESLLPGKKYRKHLVLSKPMIVLSHASCNMIQVFSETRCYNRWVFCFCFCFVLYFVLFCFFHWKNMHQLNSCIIQLFRILGQPQSLANLNFSLGSRNRNWNWVQTLRINMLVQKLNCMPCLV